MKETLTRLLADQRAAELWALERLDQRSAAGGWEPARYVDHFTRWRRRFVDFVSGPGAGQLPDTDATNAADLDQPLPPEDVLREHWSDAFDRVAALLDRSTEADLGRAIGWYTAPNLGVAILRNSVNHPREHLVELAYDLDDRPAAARFARALAAAVSDIEFRDADPRFRAAAHGMRAIAAALEGQGEVVASELERCREERPELAEAVLKDARWGALLTTAR